ncbi:1,4-dihydroxy-2-naphthoate polyprenyltransferase [Sporolactobacillus sp. Y61]|uniref:1,4-dihydroxy-2-naphthoate polyprenyltransferase n=1 Tax=Sporolactobacillus sp. Y61 TaxID=3160863 RepID=A0AAU8IFP2_9BACL
MSLRTFLELVQIQTKLTCLFPFIAGCLLAFYRFGTFRPINTLIFITALLVFVMTTTAINNYMDFRKATSDDYRRRKNIIGQAGVPEWQIVAIILIMFSIATGLGIWLAFRTDLVLLLLGAAAFAIGILYSFGPIPLSRMPLGEIFSGVTEGFINLFLAVYINAYDQGIVNLIWQDRLIQVRMDIVLILEMILVSLPFVFTIANIMLANNICDLEEDISNHRYTLPYYIGKRHAIQLYNGLYAASFAAIVVCIVLRILPAILLLTLLMAVPVYRLCRRFSRVQLKSKTFIVSVKSLALVNGTLTMLLFIAVIL